MDTIKKYEKFKSYKTLFTILMTVLLASSIFGFVIYSKKMPVGLWNFPDGLIQAKESSAILELLFLLCIFISGPTIYAPVASFSAVLIYGAITGCRIASASDGQLFSIFIEAFFSTLSAYLIVIYATFVALTGLRIFTDEKTNNNRVLFDGVMFRAVRFRGIFNLRYIASYIAFFLLFLILVTLCVMTKLFLISI